MSPAELVNEYLQAFYAGNFERAKTLVSDNFHFKDLFVKAANKESFFQSAAPLAQIAKGHRILRQWVDGNEVCSIFEMNLETPVGKGVVTMCEWHTVRGGKLISRCVILDTAYVPNRGINNLA